MSLSATVGPEGNLLEMNPAQCRRLLLASPVLSIEEMNALKHLKVLRWLRET
jgi:glutamate synthase (NADPH/NADH)